LIFDFFFFFRDLNTSAPVAVLNSVLNNQSKGTNPLFYKCPSGASSYGLIVSSEIKYSCFFFLRKIGATKGRNLADLVQIWEIYLTLLYKRIAKMLAI